VQALLLEVREVDVLMAFLLDKGLLLAPEQIVLNLPTLDSNASSMRPVLGFYGLNFIGRKLGGADRRVGHALRAATQARASGEALSADSEHMLRTLVTNFRKDAADASGLLMAVIQLTLWFWVRHPHRAAAARRLVRAVELEEIERAARLSA
jgi:hypothetical protein